MIDRANTTCRSPGRRRLLNISRGSVYYLPRPMSSKPTLRSCGVSTDCIWSSLSPARRMLRGLLAGEGCKIGRRHVKTLMKRMGIEALYRRPRTTKPEPGHKIYPYLLRGMAIPRPNQVWAMDITYIPMARGFVYLAVVLDWFSPPRAVVAAVDHDGGGVLHRDAWRMPWLVTARRRSAIPTRVRSSLARHSPACWRKTSHRHQHGRQRGLAG